MTEPGKIQEKTVYQYFPTVLITTAYNVVLTVQVMNETRIGSLAKVKVFSNIANDNRKLIK